LNNCSIFFYLTYFLSYRALLFNLATAFSPKYQNTILARTFAPGTETRSSFLAVYIHCGKLDLTAEEKRKDENMEMNIRRFIAAPRLRRELTLAWCKIFSLSQLSIKMTLVFGLKHPIKIICNAHNSLQ